jgi:hypothetical protein
MLDQIKNAVSSMAKPEATTKLLGAAEVSYLPSYTDKKENQNFLIYKEIQI